MPEYIERGAAKQKIGDLHFQNYGLAITAIMEMPTADVVSREVFEQVKWERDTALHTLQEHGIGLGEKADVVEVKHGEWKIMLDDYGCEYMMCSCCKEEFYPVDEDTVDTTPNYCPHCGAKMDLKEGAESG